MTQVLLMVLWPAFSMAWPADAQPNDGSGAPIVAAQDRAPEEAHEADVLDVIALRKAQSVEVAHVLSELGFNVVVEPSTNSMVYQGPAEDLERVRQLVSRLDSIEHPRQARASSLLPVRHRSADALADHLMKVLGGERDTRIAADESRSMLLASGPEGFMEEVRRLVERLDTPSRSVQLEFAFFQADMTKQDRSGEIPADLAEVGAELSRFGHVQLLGRMGTVGMQGESFAVEGFLAASYSAKLEGQIQRVSQEGFTELRLEASLKMDSRTPREGGIEINTGAFFVRTNVAAQPGQYLVLGSAAAGLEPGQSIILVMQIKNPASAGTSQ